MAIRAAQSMRRRYCGRLIVCWDLDNTLVDTGSLLAKGLTLEQAVVHAKPLGQMLEFLGDVRAALPDARHVIVSARRARTRPGTFAWLARYGPEFAAEDICLVPSPQLKPRAWRILGDGMRLAIIDDLHWGQERGPDDISPYEELILEAEDVASAYVGQAAIMAAASDPARRREVVSWLVSALRP